MIPPQGQDLDASPSLPPDSGATPSAPPDSGAAPPDQSEDNISPAPSQDDEIQGREIPHSLSANFFADSATIRGHSATIQVQGTTLRNPTVVPQTLSTTVPLDDLEQGPFEGIGLGTIVEEKDSDLTDGLETVGEFTIKRSNFLVQLVNIDQNAHDVLGANTQTPDGFMVAAAPSSPTAETMNMPAPMNTKEMLSMSFFLPSTYKNLYLAYKWDDANLGSHIEKYIVSIVFNAVRCRACGWGLRYYYDKNTFDLLQRTAMWKLPAPSWESLVVHASDIAPDSVPKGFYEEYAEVRADMLKDMRNLQYVWNICCLRKLSMMDAMCIIMWLSTSGLMSQFAMTNAGTAGDAVFNKYVSNAWKNGAQILAVDMKALDDSLEDGNKWITNSVQETRSGSSDPVVVETVDDSGFIGSIYRMFSTRQKHPVVVKSGSEETTWKIPEAVFMRDAHATPVTTRDGDHIRDFLRSRFPFEFAFIPYGYGPDWAQTLRHSNPAGNNTGGEDTLIYQSASSGAEDTLIFCYLNVKRDNTHDQSCLMSDDDYNLTFAPSMRRDKDFLEMVRDHRHRLCAYSGWWINADEVPDLEVRESMIMGKKEKNGATAYGIDELALMGLVGFIPDTPPSVFRDDARRTVCQRYINVAHTQLVRNISEDNKTEYYKRIVAREGAIAFQEKCAFFPLNAMWQLTGSRIQKWCGAQSRDGWDYVPDEHACNTNGEFPPNNENGERVYAKYMPKCFRGYVSPRGTFLPPCSYAEVCRFTSQKAFMPAFFFHNSVICQCGDRIAGPFPIEGDYEPESRELWEQIKQYGGHPEWTKEYYDQQWVKNARKLGPTLLPYYE